MRFSEFGMNEGRQVAIQPAAVQQQSRINKVVANYAASEQRQQNPTETEIAIAMQRYGEMKRQAQKRYIARLRMQLAATEGENLS
jgi:hypothetical protein